MLSRMIASLHQTLHQTLHRFQRDERGAAAVFIIFMIAMVVGAGAMTVDVGSFYFLKRKQQTATDIAALSAAANMGNMTNAANANAKANGYQASSVVVEQGVYVANATLASNQRFTPTTVGANAVRVTMVTQAPMIFGRIFSMGASTVQPGTVSIKTVAIAANAAKASFAIGSSLLNLDGGIVNGMLGALLGTNLSLSLMDYQSLASVNIDLFAFSKALKTRANLTAVTYSDLLSANVRISDIMKAAGDAVSTSTTTSSAAVAAMTSISAASASNYNTIKLSALMDFGSYDSATITGSAPMTVALSAFDMVNAVAQIANTKQQLQTALNINIAGLASATLQVAVGERPVGTSMIAVGSTGTTVHTAQTRMLLTVAILGSGTASVIYVPYYIELAAGTATLTALSCSPSNSVTLGVTPSVIDAWIGNVSTSDMTNFSSAVNPPAATILNVLGLVTVTARAHVSISNLTPTSVTFNASEIAAMTKKTTSTTSFISSLLSSLLGDLQLTVNIIGLPFGLGGLSSLIGSILATAVSPLDTLISQVLTALGLNLGNATTWVTGVSCGSTALVS